MREQASCAGAQRWSAQLSSGKHDGKDGAGLAPMREQASCAGAQRWSAQLSSGKHDGKDGAGLAPMQQQASCAGAQRWSTVEQWQAQATETTAPMLEQASFNRGSRGTHRFILEQRQAQASSRGDGANAGAGQLHKSERAREQTQANVRAGWRPAAGGSASHPASTFGVLGSNKTYQIS